MKSLILFIKDYRDYRSIGHTVKNAYKLAKNTIHKEYFK